MKRSNRLLIALVFVEVLLAAIGWWLLSKLADGSLQPTNSLEETTQTIFSVLGTAMGVIAGVIGIAVIAMRRKGL